MPIQYRFTITAEDENPFFADPERACADLRRILIERATRLVQPEALEFHAEEKAFTYIDNTDFDFVSLMEGLPVSMPTVNGAKVFLNLMIQRGEWAKLRG